MTPKVEKYFCNECAQETKHYIRGEHQVTEDSEGISFYLCMGIIECCGCENLAFVKTTGNSEDEYFFSDPETGQTFSEHIYETTIYPPVSYRRIPPWFEDLPDNTLRMIFKEIYQSLEVGSLYLATFGSRTLVDRLIVLTVGDRGGFYKGLKALEEEGKLSKDEREILEPVVDAGNAAAHRAWVPNKEQLSYILDTVESLIHRLFVLPEQTEALKEAVPAREKRGKQKNSPKVLTISEKIEIAPQSLKTLYAKLDEHIQSFGKDVVVHPRKHYIAYRRRQNFASVEVFNTKKIIRLYLNLDPDQYAPLDSDYMRDVRQIGHFGTGDLEITIQNEENIKACLDLLQQSYDNSV